MPLAIDLKGQTAIITGGNRGIGLAISRSFAQAGADLAIVYATDSNAPKVAEDLAREFGVLVQAFKCPVEDGALVESTVDEIFKCKALTHSGETSPNITILIANSGISDWRPAELTSPETFAKLFQVNTFGVFHFASSVARRWIPSDLASSNATTLAPGMGMMTGPTSKKMVFNASISASVAMIPQLQTAYNCSKAATKMMAQSLAGEWARYGIRVNSVSPGYVLTDMIANPPDEESRSCAAVWQSRTPAGFMAKAEDISELFVFLSSDMARFITGSDYLIDGGYTIF